MDGLNEEGMHVHSPPVKGDGEREKEGGIGSYATA
jgi:hypothetical protein